MYSYEKRIAAVEAYIRNGRKGAKTVRELGYPTVNALKQWYSEYAANGETFSPKRKIGRFTPEQRQAAVDYYLAHGKNGSRTCRDLGYPDYQALAEWIDKLAPGCKRPRRQVESFSEEQKLQAVIDLARRDATKSAVAAKHGTTATSLRRWSKEMLGEEFPVERKPSEGQTVEQLQDRVSQLKAEVSDLEAQVRQLKLERDVYAAAAEVVKKGPSTDLRSSTGKEKAEVISALEPNYTQKELLALLAIPRSSYNYRRLALRRPDKHADLRKRVRASFEASEGRYGYRRVYADLRDGGGRPAASEKVVARIMREEGLVAKRSKRRRYSSYKGELSKAPDNIVDRDFHADKPNKKWLTDITEFGIAAGKVYLSPIVDCFDGLVVSHTTSTSSNAELANSSLKAACATLKGDEQPIIHSDRGCHYRWPGWIKLCEDNHLTRSMSKKGCSPDNAACEGFFGRLKIEFFYNRDWSQVSTEEFSRQLDEYIRWYNEDRIKLSLGGLSPVQYRQKLGVGS